MAKHRRRTKKSAGISPVLSMLFGLAVGLSVAAAVYMKDRRDDAYMNAALLEKMFDMGRYVFLCSSGDWPPRLSGIWTGSWNPEWQGDYTLDANVNLAVSGGNIGALLEPMQGYVSLIEGMIRRICDELGREDVCVIGTGGLISTIASQTTLIDHVEPWLTLTGLGVIYRLNRGESSKG